MILRPLVAGVEEVRAPWTSWHRTRPLPVGLRHAKRVHAPLGPLTLPCLTLGATVGFFSPPRWVASWGISLDKCSGHTADRWSETPECSFLRQYPVLEEMMAKERHRSETRPNEPETHTSTCEAERSCSLMTDFSLRAALDFGLAPHGAVAAALVVVAAAASLSQPPFEMHRTDIDAGGTVHPGPATSSGEALRSLELPVEEDPELAVPEFKRQDSEWSFLSHSLHTVESRELNELESSDEDRPKPAKTRWRSIKDFFRWRT